MIRFLIIGLAALLTALPLAGPAAGEEAEAGGYFVALGDSYSSGEGVEPYDPESGDCRRSAGAYPSLAAGQDPAADWTYGFVACSGATTDDVNGPDATGQAHMVEELGVSVRLVTITIGGNDARFADMLRRCALGSMPCTEENDNEEAWIEEEVRPRLKATYARLRAASEPARIVVVTYPHIFQTERHCGREPGIQNDEKAWIRDRTNQLNDLIDEEATAADLDVLDVRDAFEGHEICTSEPWTSGWGEPGAFHPNAAGHEELARQLVDLLNR
ncbi:MAG: SGNH/GDSL hydrolase family protein [Acidimicrobiia bacterium]